MFMRRKLAFADNIKERVWLWLFFWVSSGASFFYSPLSPLPKQLALIVCVAVGREGHHNPSVFKR